MSTTTRKPRPRPERRAHLIIAAEPGRPAAVELSVGKQSGAYLVTEIRTDLGGRAFAVEKISTGEVYHARVAPDVRTCDCPGGTYKGRCKHSDGLAALIEAGRL